MATAAAKPAEGGQQGGPSLQAGLCSQALVLQGLRLCALVALIGAVAPARGGPRVALLPEGDGAPLGIDYLASEGAPSELGVAVNLVGRNRTFIPISSEFFETSDGPATGNCAELVRVAAERGRGLWGLVDLLHWEPDSSVRSTVLEKRPELVELNLQAGCGLSPSRGRYASPWRQDVRSSLVALAEAIGRHASRPLALVVRCRLSPTEMLAYNDAARAAYIRAAQLDPADLLIGTPTPSDRARTTRWLQWRLTTMTGFLGEVVHAYRKARPSGRVTAAVLANQYRRSLIERSYAAEDWLTWILDGIIDGVLLEGAWEEGSEDRDYASALGIIAKTGKEIEIGVMLRAPSKEGDTALARQQEIVLAQGRAPDYWMIEVNDEAGLQAAQEFLAAQPRGPAPDAP